MNEKDFLNPKSMLTPGIAGAIVTMLTNTLSIQFSLPVRWTALVLSLVLALVVFRAVVTPRWHRPVYYVFNALIIFSVATGTNTVGVAATGGEAGNKGGEEVLESERVRLQEQLTALDDKMTQTLKPEEILTAPLSTMERERLRQEHKQVQEQLEDVFSEIAEAAKKTPPSSVKFFRPWF